MESRLELPLKITIEEQDLKSSKFKGGNLYFKIGDEYGSLIDINGYFNKEGMLNGEGNVLFHNMNFTIDKKVETFYQIFRGTFVNGKLNGHGKCVYHHIDRDKSHLNMSFEGKWVNNIADGTNFRFTDNLKTLIGEWRNGYYVKERCVLVNYKDGSSYLGFFNNGSSNGLGMYECPDYKITGFFDKWKVYSQNAKLTYKNGVTYVGGYIDNKRNGWGVEDSINKMESGYWQDDKLIFRKRKEFKTCLHPGCNDKSAIFCVDCGQTYCITHFNKTHNTPKASKHTTINLNIDELIADIEKYNQELEDVKLTSQINNINNLTKKLKLIKEGTVTKVQKSGKEVHKAITEPERTSEPPQIPKRLSSSRCESPPVEEDSLNNKVDEFQSLLASFKAENKGVNFVFK